VNGVKYSIKKRKIWSRFHTMQRKCNNKTGNGEKDEHYRVVRDECYNAVFVENILSRLLNDSA
jgi:hypothetical protein